MDRIIGDHKVLSFQVPFQSKQNQVYHALEHARRLTPPEGVTKDAWQEAVAHFWAMSAPLTCPQGPLQDQTKVDESWAAFSQKLEKSLCQARCHFTPETEVHLPRNKWMLNPDLTRKDCPRIISTNISKGTIAAPDFSFQERKMQRQAYRLAEMRFGCINGI